MRRTAEQLTVRASSGMHVGTPATVIGALHVADHDAVRAFYRDEIRFAELVLEHQLVRCAAVLVEGGAVRGGRHGDSGRDGNGGDERDAGHRCSLGGGGEEPL